MIAPMSTPLIKQACPEDAEQRNYCNKELAAMHLPEMAQFLDLQQTGDGHQHDRREHGLRQIAQQVRLRASFDCPNARPADLDDSTRP
jgi:hypothetical protein